MSDARDLAGNILLEVFGLTHFRAGQATVIQTVLAGKSALALFPTGGGKSLCYQLPAIILEGLTLVVSPLIALMKDQVDYLQRKGVNAARFDSSLSLAETNEVKDSIKNGTLKILYVSPEKISNESFRRFMQGTRISLVAIDEAHCVSQWGHNFRPDYLKLARFSKLLGAETILALTATATPQVVADICKTFDIDSVDATITGFSRPNLNVYFKEVDSENKLDYLSSRIKSTAKQPTIVYVTLQKTAEFIAAELKSQGFLACAYHAGMRPESREDIQNKFMQGYVHVIVATIAFGMGIDKADIRFVFHYNLPKSLESYTQEMGRAGRDGKESYCEVIANGADVTTLLNFTYGDTPGRESLRLLCEKLDQQEAGFSLCLRTLSNELDIRPLVLNTLFTYLELDAYIEFLGIEYQTYQWKWLVSQQQCLSAFDPERASFLRKVFDCGKLGRTIVTLDMQEAVVQTSENKSRISLALSYLHDKKMIDLRLKGRKHRYRKTSNKPVAEVQEKYLQAFVLREEQEEQRLDTILNLPAANCIMQDIIKYFGEESAPCGKCSSCLHGSGMPISVEQPVLHAPEVLLEIANKHRNQLKGARPLARFLCGLPSPRLSALKLSKHEDFGLFSVYPFKHILEILESKELS